MDIILRCDTSNIDSEIKKTKVYKRWYDIHYRSYSSQLHKRYPTYIGCSVCDEWHDFYDFQSWNKENYYEVIINGKKSKMDLDKDILFKGNKVYSPETCIFVPHEINTLFTIRKSNKGDLPVGVHYDAEKNRYRAQVQSKKLGRFKKPEQAFAAYKKEKEKLIKEMARIYRNQIPDKLYQAMVHWKVEITD